MKDKHKELLNYLNECRTKFEELAEIARVRNDIRESRKCVIEAIKCSNSILHLESMMVNWQDEAQSVIVPTIEVKKLVS